MRLLLDTYEPDPEMNIFTFKNMGGRAVTGTIEAGGAIADATLEGTGKIESQGNILRVAAAGNRAILKFSTRPYNTGLKIKLEREGRPIPLSSLLVSGYALPLLSDKTGTISSSDLYLLKGTAAYAEQDSTFRIYWGREAQYRLEWEKQAGVSGVFKEMLAEWGYLSEPQKK
jgi:hypothetical protein